MPTHKVPIKCPFCGRENTALSTLDEDPAPPQEGDYSICFGCHGVAIIKADGQSRVPSPREFSAIAEDEDVQRSLSTLRRS